MKKFCLFFLILFISVFSFPGLTLAQEEVDYDLPYPGLLPDHPFYFFKTSRDSFFDFFIKDPIKKAEFNIERSDKSLKSALILYEKEGDKKDLVEKVLAKTHPFYEEALKKLEQADKQNSEVGSMVNRLELSLSKQEEVLKSLASDSRGELKKKLEEDLKKVGILLKEVEKIFPPN